MLAPVVRAGIADVWWDGEIRPSQIWRQEIEKALASARLGILLVSSDFLASGFIQNQELPFLLEAARRKRVRLFWVLVSSCPYEHSPLKEIQAAHDPSRPLSKLRKADREEALANIVRKVVKALGPEAPVQEVSARGRQAAPNLEVPYRGERPPYPGTRPFAPEDADFFFGREELTAYLIERLRGGPFLALLGPSGSGKSSLIYAGLIPALKRGELPGSDAWRIVPVKPGSEPLKDLAGRLSAFLVGYEESCNDWQLDFVKKMQNDGGALAAEIQGLDPHLLVVIDQCEAIFNPNSSDSKREERRAFFANLLNASSSSSSKATVVLVLRADMCDFGAIPDLASRIETNHVYVGPLQQDALRKAIIHPAELSGLQFEAGLVERILADVRKDRCTTPLFQEAVRELWNRREGLSLTLEAYDSFGGVKGAIASYSEASFAKLTPPQQELAGRLLVELVQPGEGTPDTRRRMLRSELFNDTGCSPDMDEIIEHLIQHRLLTADLDPYTQERTVELAHDALFQAWPKLRDWIDQTRKPRLSHQDLRKRALRWEGHDRDSGSLVDGQELEEYESLRRTYPKWLSSLEREYLEACHHRRQSPRQASELVYFNGVNPRGQYLTPPILLREVVERLLAEGWQAPLDRILR